MGEPCEPAPVRVFCGIIHRKGAAVNEALACFAERFGAPDIQSPTIPFDFTHYYAREMGGELSRLFVAFPQLQNPADAADWKMFSNEIEREFSLDASSPSRSINLDPGYVVPSRVILLTTKDFSHRIYLRNGIFAEVTLMWRHGTFVPMSWTYPDYATPLARDFFTRVRNTKTVGSGLHI